MLLWSDAEVAYGLLENIKDGYLASSKYRSKSLKIRSLNTVIIFSNSFPIKKQLLKDRWMIFEICGDELNSFKANDEWQQLVGNMWCDS